ncbi:hypothetical protein LTR37_006668 [Vermiconidia calcicola]|uniref:Uncharacterized protein n=1 Tax=Vermiconidia calcicola TaxID=1690605 RepID=A0ACC3NHP4_9PEZI|nr:hypothetical protein LTR37_006668 [Vermiconidia calcicola]
MDLPGSATEMSPSEQMNDDHEMPMFGDDDEMDLNPVNGMDDHMEQAQQHETDDGSGLFVTDVEDGTPPSTSPDSTEQDDTASTNSDDEHDEDGSSTSTAAEDAEDHASPFSYTPFELLNIDSNDRYKLNLKYRKLPRGELSAGRNPSARYITWLVEYSRSSPGVQYAYFYTDRERYGGPFAFLSNHHSCNFQVLDEESSHTFSSMEQYYQWSKAKCIAAASPRAILSKVDRSTIIHSRALPAYILSLEDPNDCDKAGKSFDALLGADTDWEEEWHPGWLEKKKSVLGKGVQAKFDQNQELAYLLMMTGDFELVKASHNDRDCGIGQRAALAKEDRQAGKWGKNLLGKALQRTRDMMRVKYGVVEQEYAFNFWRLWEETSNNERYRELMQKEGVIDPTTVPSGKPKFDDTRSRDQLDAEMGTHKEAWKQAHLGSADEGYTSDRASETPEGEG